MLILALNTEKHHIDNLPCDEHGYLPNKGDELWYKDKEYEVIRRIFQYDIDGIDIVNIIVKPTL